MRINAAGVTVRIPAGNRQAVQFDSRIFRVVVPGTANVNVEHAGLLVGVDGNPRDVVLDVVERRRVDLNRFRDFKLRPGKGYRRALQARVERNDAAERRVRLRVGNRFAERNPTVVRVDDVRRRRYDRRRRFLDEKLVRAEVDATV